MAETRYQRIAREQRERRALRDAMQKSTEKAKRQANTKLRASRNADRIDGYDRDDLGHSADY